jgi:hypothetical protein
LKKTGGYYILNSIEVFGMADRTKVPFFNPDGTITQEIGTVVNVVHSDEPWSEYILEDGSKLRIKQTVVNVVKLDKTADNDEPIYSIQSQQTLSVLPRIQGIHNEHHDL